MIWLDALRIVWTWLAAISTGTPLPLAGFSGKTPNGTWQLQAQDFFSEDTGNIRAFSLVVTPAVCDAPAIGANVSGTETVTGSFSPGGAITYTVVLTNNGAGTQQDNPGHEFTDVLPSTLTLVSASATSGAAVANVVTNTVTWDGSLAGTGGGAGGPGGGSVTISINATVKAGASGTVSNQGTISYDADGDGTNESTAVTDDPSTPAANDPTTFAVGAAIATVPTLSDFGLAALGLALMGAALVLLRRRREQPTI